MQERPAAARTVLGAYTGRATSQVVVEAAPGLVGGLQLLGRSAHRKRVRPPVSGWPTGTGKARSEGPLELRSARSVVLKEAKRERLSRVPPPLQKDHSAKRVMPPSNANVP